MFTARNCFYIVCLFVLFHSTNASIFDYFPLGKSLFSSDTEQSNDVMQKVPYEVEVTDEKFIEQAAKFTGVSLSDLDKCQHRVIYKLQTECHKLNDEDLAKLAVKLLNCQSSIEGRKVYPCTDAMPIRDCTSKMDPDTWNSYLLMSNRARAVCYSIRQAQFRGLTEMTVNKLMGAAHEQLALMTRLGTSQSKIEEATTDAFMRIKEDTSVLREQQQDLQKAQFYGQLVIEDNIRRLADEKQLIIEGHEQIAGMTKSVQIKLDEAARQIDNQAEKHKTNHKEILADLIAIQNQAQEIFARIEKSSRDLIASTTAARLQYSSTLQHLSEINKTISTLGRHVQWLGNTLEEHVKWMGAALGGTDDALERLSTVVQHVLFLLLAMVACAFLHIGNAGRIGLVILVPLNLLMKIWKLDSLDIQGLTFATIALVVMQALVNFALNYRRKQTLHIKQSGNVEEVEEDDAFDSTVNSTCSDSFAYASSNYASNTYRRFDLDTTERDSMNDFNGFVSPTPPLSRISRSRSKTPAVKSPERNKCSATTRMGTPCKSTALLGRDYCYRHQTGSSVIVG